SHAGVDGLLELVRGLKSLKHVVIVHTNERAGSVFASKIKESLNEVSVHLPQNGEELLLEV
ncbi:MAG: MBL fold metallo-hydrolase RNA specificity domain-containing protein, partial [Zestosphaera sp.]